MRPHGFTVCTLPTAVHTAAYICHFLFSSCFVSSHPEPPKRPLTHARHVELKGQAAFHVTGSPHSTFFPSDTEHLISPRLKIDFCRPILPLLHPFFPFARLYTRAFYWLASLRRGPDKAPPPRLLWKWFVSVREMPGSSDGEYLVLQAPGLLMKSQGEEARLSTGKRARPRSPLKC